MTNEWNLSISLSIFIGKIFFQRICNCTLLVCFHSTTKSGRNFYFYSKANKMNARSLHSYMYCKLRVQWGCSHGQWKFDYPNRFGIFRWMHVMHSDKHNILFHSYWKVRICIVVIYDWPSSSSFVSTSHDKQNIFSFTRFLSIQTLHSVSAYLSKRKLCCIYGYGEGDKTFRPERK